MALSRFPATMDENISAVTQVMTALRQIKEGAGPLTWSDIDRVQTGLERAKMTFIAAMGEASKAPTAAEAFMVSLNGPATLAEYQAGAVGIETAATAWNVRLVALLNSLSVADLITLAVRQPSQTRHFNRATHLPAIFADPLRQSQELGDLIAAFTAAGV